MKIDSKSNKIQPSHTRRKYVGWCQVSSTATTCPVRRRFASKTSSKLSLPAGVPSTIKRNWLLTKKPDTMTRNSKKYPGFRAQEAPVLMTDSYRFHSFWSGNHGQSPFSVTILTCSTWKHIVLYGKLTCIMRKHLLLKGKNERIKESNWDRTAYSRKSRCLIGNSRLLAAHNHL